VSPLIHAQYPKYGSLGGGIKGKMNAFYCKLTNTFYVESRYYKMSNNELYESKLLHDKKAK